MGLHRMKLGMVLAVGLGSLPIVQSLLTVGNPTARQAVRALIGNATLRVVTL